MASATSSAVPIRPSGTSAATLRGAVRAVRSVAQHGRPHGRVDGARHDRVAAHRVPGAAQWSATDRETLITAALLAA